MKKENIGNWQREVSGKQRESIVSLTVKEIHVGYKMFTFKKTKNTTTTHFRWVGFKMFCHLGLGPLFIVHLYLNA